MKGYVAIITVLVVSAIVVTIGVTLTLTSISEDQMSLAGKKSAQSLDLVEACVEEALLKLNEDSAIPAQINLPIGGCDVNIEQQVGENWTFLVNALSGGYQKRVRVIASRSDRVYITSWEEVN